MHLQIIPRYTKYSKIAQLIYRCLFVFIIIYCIIFVALLEFISVVETYQQGIILFLSLPDHWNLDVYVISASYD